MTSLWPTYLLRTLPNVYSARMMTENYMKFFFYSIVMFNYDYMVPVLSNARNFQSTHVAYSIFARLSLHAFNFDNRRNNYTR